MRYKYFLLYLHLLAYASAMVAPGDWVEERLTKLEKIVENLEKKLVTRYGLIAHCELPSPENGRVICDSEQLKDGATCRVLCNSGYMSVPGHRNITCLKNGEWNLELKCEVPVVVLSGGQVGQGVVDSSVEIFDLDSYKECKPIIPDMPLQNNTHRSFHNLIYDPNGHQILACNGLSTVNLATCDTWKLDPETTNWKFHSLPNKGKGLEMAMDALSAMGGPIRSMQHPDVQKGRYAAESLTIKSRPTILGGMVYDDVKHEATHTSRTLIKDVSKNKDQTFKVFWSSESSRTYHNRACELPSERAFFCAVKIDDYGIVSIGGFRNKTVLDNVTYSHCQPVDENEEKEILNKWNTPMWRNVISMSNLPIPLSGHGCTTLPNSNDILVSGGQRFETDQTQAQTLIYTWANRSWTKEWDMEEPRFGHKVFTIGDKIFAVGGRNKDTILNSIEEFDTQTKKWKKLSLRLKKPRAHFGLVLVPRSSLSLACQP